ncbi:MAG: hypothetical protein IPJ39_22525 [Saprospiraceae bacterium]|nr:hypothetical protein [Saprospiraceae bacterium]
MNVKSLTEFKHELDATLDSVSDGDDTVIIIALTIKISFDFTKILQ